MTSREQTIIASVIVCIIAFFVACVSLMLLSTAVHAQEPITCAQVCPTCNVKAEWTGDAYEYEYTDGTATITGTTPISVCWQAVGSRNISKARIKAGQNLYWPDPDKNCWQTPSQDISHVIVCTEKSTAITLIDFRAAPDDNRGDILIWLMAIGILTLAAGIMVNMRRKP